MIWSGLALFLGAGAASQGQPPAVSLDIGQAVVIHYDDGGAVGAPSREAAEWTPFTLYAARMLAGETPPDVAQRYAQPIGHQSDAPPAEPPVPSQIRFRFLSIGGRHSLLAVDNGLRRAIAYRARITSNGRTQPTDVCLVMPGRQGFEHWPYAISRIEISDIHEVAWQQGQPVTCE